MHLCYVDEISLVPGGTYLQSCLVYWASCRKNSYWMSKKVIEASRAKWNQNVVVFDNFLEKLIEALASMLYAYQIDTLENEWRNQIV